jgi:hypothetical protein
VIMCNSHYHIFHIPSHFPHCHINFALIFILHTFAVPKYVRLFQVIGISNVPAGLMGYF